MIKAICYNYNAVNDYKNSKNVTFSGADAVLAKEVISKKSKALLKQVQEVLVEEIVKIRKQKAVPGKYLEISKTHPKNKCRVSLTPLYNDGQDGSLMLEIKRFDSTEVININRRNPENFRYEKRVPTQSGHATTKTFDSRIQNNETIEEKVDMLLQEYLPVFLKKKPSIHDHIV